MKSKESTQDQEHERYEQHREKWQHKRRQKRCGNKGNIRKYVKNASHNSGKVKQLKNERTTTGRIELSRESSESPKQLPRVGGRVGRPQSHNQLDHVNERRAEKHKNQIRYRMMSSAGKGCWRCVCS